MNFKDKFDEIVDYIEAQLYQETRVIQNNILKKYANGDPRAIDPAFEFITGMRVREYITRRKLIRILELRKENGWAIEKAADEFGYSSATNYMRDFKRYFGTTVLGMSDEEFAKEKKPLYITQILKREEDTLVEKETEETMIFGMSKSRFDIIWLLAELSRYYDFTEEQAEETYELMNDLKEQVDYELKDIANFSVEFIQASNYINQIYPKVDPANLAIACFELDVDIYIGLVVAREIDEYHWGSYKSIPREVWELMKDESFGMDFMQSPTYLLELVDCMKQFNIPTNQVNDILLFGKAYGFGFAPDLVKEYMEGEKEGGECFENSDIIEKMKEIEEEYWSIEKTYDENFSGIPRRRY